MACCPVLAVVVCAVTAALLAGPQPSQGVGAPLKQQIPQQPASARAARVSALQLINVGAVQKQPQAGVTVRIEGSEPVLSLPAQWFTVIWEGVTDPKIDDWLALYVPGDADPGLTVPAKLRYATDAPSHLIHGNGSLRFRVLNYHRSVRFAFMRGGVVAPVHVADSPPIRSAAFNHPTQLHLALTGSDPTEMSVQWVTWNASRPAVRWGLAPGNLPHTTPANTTSYSPDDLCAGSIATSTGWMPPGALHNAVLRGLQPGARYHYSVGDMEEGAWSDVRSFLAAPPRGQGYRHATPLRPLAPSDVQSALPPHHNFARMSPAARSAAARPHELDDSSSHQLKLPWRWARKAPRHQRCESKEDDGGGWSPLVRSDEGFGADPTVRFLAVADMGQAEVDGSNSVQECMYASLNTTRWLDQEGDSVSLVVHPGDLAYSRGILSQWDNFLSQIEPVASRMPYMVQPGNHERDWPGSGDRFDGVPDSWGECGRVYAARFAMPTTSWDAQWYSFDHGPIHFIAISTEHPTAPGTPQHAFIVADLAAVNRRVTPWLVVLGHRPFYMSSTADRPPDGDHSTAAEMRADLEPYFLKYKVDLVITGHHHSYQRTSPIADGKCVGYDVRGVARGPVYVIVGIAGAGLSLALEAPPPAYIERIVVWWGYARVEASRSRLRLEAISDSDGGLFDALVLRK